MAPNVSSRIFAFLVYLAFFCSGAASLVAEVTWNRMLIVVVGNSLSATAMIIIVFMGGLGLGSFVGGKVFARRRASLAPYVALEATIGLFVLVSPVLFGLLETLFSSLAPSVANQTGLTLVRVVTNMLALLLPAFLMGATFPAMISGTAPRTATAMSARTGYLYSLNTLGAAIGTFVAGYHLLLEFGVRLTLGVACGLYGLAALCALLAAGLVRGGNVADLAEPVTEPAVATGPAGDPGRRRFLFVATFAIGFVALAYEVLLTRLGILHLGNSVSVFPLVLTGFLLGTGISAVAGTWFYGYLARRGPGADRLFGILAVAAGLFVLLTPYLLLTDWLVGPLQAARAAEAAPRNPLPILLIIIGPTVLVGALLPVAIRMLQLDGRGEATREAATLYSLNTAGGILGAGLANHYLVPVIGLQGTLLVLAAACLLVGLVNLLALGRSPSRWLAAGGATVAAVAVLGLALPDMIQLYAQRIAHSTRADSAAVKLIVEGRAATVTVLDQFDLRRGDYRDMYLNGVEEASTRYWHAQLFKLLGILPVLVHEGDEPKDTLVIAFGAGITAGSVLASDAVGSLDVVDLNPDIEGINDLFTEVNGDVFHEPRFRFHNDDGRNYLVTSGKRYDVIVNDSTHPRAYDSWILYTREFYEAVARRLESGGVFAQWVPVLGSMRGELMRIHLNTFRSVFPNATFWYVYGSDQAFLMATPEPYAMDAGAMQQKLDGLPEWFLAGKYDLDSVEEIAGFFWLDGPAMERMIAGETRLNTDDVHYFDKQSAVWPLPPQFHLPMFQASMVPYLAGADPALASAVRQEQAVALALGRYAFYGSSPDLHRAYCAAPDNGNVRYFMSLAFAGDLPDLDAFCREEAVRTYREIVARHPENARALNALADALTRQGELDEALTVAERALALEPGNGAFLDTKGWILSLQSRHDAALDLLEAANEALNGHPIVYYHLGATRLAAGDEEGARRALERALAHGDEFEGHETARELLESLD